MLRKNFFQPILVFITAFVGCGKNVFQNLEKKDPAEDAAIYLEKGESQKAIDLLNEALIEDPHNYKFMSVLSMAYAQKAGIDPLKLAEKMGSERTSWFDNHSIDCSVPSSSPATDESISNVELAVSWLSRIPADQRVKADTFKLGIFQTSSTALRSKKLDKNGDGFLSTDELLSLSNSEADAILSNLVTAQNTFSGSGSDPASALAGRILSEIRSGIDASSGATPQDKLRNYLASK